MSATTLPPAAEAAAGQEPGTYYLLRNDIRLARRELRVGRRSQKITIAVIGLGVILLLHLIGYASAPKLANLHAAGGDSLPMVTVLLIGIASLCLSKALSGVIDQMREQGDLELLVTSPLRPRILLRARLIAIALGAGALPFIAAVPVVNGMAMHGKFDWVGAYPVLVSLSVIAAVVAVGAFLGLLAVIGPRRARFAARVIATVLGAAAFLASQTTIVLSPERRGALWDAIKPADSQHPAGLGWLAARAMYGEPISILLLCAIAAGGVIAITVLFEKSYGAGAIAILNADRGGQAGRDARFGDSLPNALIRKEIRNFYRQPGLAIQIAYQFVFLIPAAAAVLRLSNGVPASASVLFISVMMTGRIASVFLDVVVRNDRAAELVHSAPIDQTLPFRIKTALLVIAVFAISAPLMGLIALRLPAALGPVMLTTTGGVVTRFWMELRKPVPVRTGTLRGRLHVSPASLMGAMTDIAWSIAGTLLLAYLYRHQY